MAVATSEVPIIAAALRPAGGSAISSGTPFKYMRVSAGTRARTWSRKGVDPIGQIWAQVHLVCETFDVMIHGRCRPESNSRIAEDTSRYFDDLQTSFCLRSFKVRCMSFSASLGAVIRVIHSS